MLLHSYAWAPAGVVCVYMCVVGGCRLYKTYMALTLLSQLNFANLETLVFIREVLNYKAFQRTVTYNKCIVNSQLVLVHINVTAAAAPSNLGKCT